MIIFLLVISVILLASVFINFFFFLKRGKKLWSNAWFGIIEIISVIIMPVLFLLIFDFSQENDCCYDSAVFSPEHRGGIYILILAGMIAYIISRLRDEVFPPLAEVLLNTLLVLGLVINLLLLKHLYTDEPDFILPLLGNLPIILLLLMEIHRNHVMLQTYIPENELEVNGLLGGWAVTILQLNQVIKYPAFLILLMPLLIFVTLFLLVFGQSPDTLIRAFTDTYKHGFSQLDHLCENVECGGHFLCSVGANGHKNIVKPIRYGERNGARIICNRQLLISNAFEDLVQEKLPKTHQLIRRNYNKVGNVIHRYYGIFNNKFISDVVYLLMKPLEWIFLISLYTFDNKPENRISKQYINVKHFENKSKAI